MIPPLLPSCTVGGSAITRVAPALIVPDTPCLCFCLSAICQPLISIALGDALRMVTVSCSGAGPIGLTSAPTMRTTWSGSLGPGCGPGPGSGVSELVWPVVSSVCQACD